MLKRNPESAKTISRPQVTVTQPKGEPAKPQPTPNTGVGGSSLDTMTAACAKALGEFYAGLHDHADTLVEGYQGVAEKILTYKDMPIRTLDTVADGVAYLRDMYNVINKLQGMMPYSEIVNNLDLVKDSINGTKYKLLFLK